MIDQPQRTWAIVLAGGDGTRLSALTRALYGRPVPKQFAAIDGVRSLLQATLERSQPIVPLERTIVVVGPSHVALAREQLSAFAGITLLVQPASLGTAGAILYGLAWLRARDPTAGVIVFPSDHHVDNVRGFVTVVIAAAAASSRTDRVVLVGTRPSTVDPDYGWIVPGGAIEPGMRCIRTFVEKPHPTIVAALVEDGGLVNTFVIAAPSTTLARLVRARLPVHAARFDAWSAGAAEIADVFRGLPAADFSRDVLQPAADLAVFTMHDVGWCDWGTPERILASLRGTVAERRLRDRLFGEEPPAAASP